MDYSNFAKSHIELLMTDTYSSEDFTNSHSIIVQFEIADPQKHLQE